MKIRPWWETFLQLIFPGNQLCYLCWEAIEGQNNPGVCSSCREKILKISNELKPCPRCSYFSPLGPCSNCQDWGNHLEKVISVVPYEGMYREWIQNVKYGGREELAQALGALMAWKLKESDLHSKIHFVLPVPLHPSKEEERGYNQSRWLARQIAKELACPLKDGLLLRQEKRDSQANLPRQQRLTNLNRAFIVEEFDLSHKNVLLVDDIITTGSTLIQCAMILKDKGAARVFGLTWAAGFDKRFVNLAGKKLNKEE